MSVAVAAIDDDIAAAASPAPPLVFSSASAGEVSTTPRRRRLLLSRIKDGAFRKRNAMKRFPPLKDGQSDYFGDPHTDGAYGDSLSTG